jgi:hypothetical protein
MERAEERPEVFRPRLSGWIMGLYWSLLVLLSAIFLGLAFLAGIEAPLNLLLVCVFILIFALFAFVLSRAHGMRYTVTGSRLVIRGIFNTNVIPRSDIKSVEKTPVPFGFRLFGASFLGGLYYLPGIGRAWVAMGNFKDGVLVTTRQGKHYVITPQRPLEFVKAVQAAGR